MSSNSHPVNILMILDGWGIRDEKQGNAFALADTPFLDFLLKNFPNCKLYVPAVPSAFPKEQWATRKSDT